MKKYNGAISLFMVIILLSSFIFGGVFIDASRVIVAKNKVKTSMNSALRSSISYYDTKLVGDYGLYAFDGETAKTNFDKYFKANMRIKDSGINMFKYTINDSKITYSTPITDDAELRRQIAEYSKYRAPVTTTMLLVEKVAGVFADMKNCSDEIGDSADDLDNFKKEFKKGANQVTEGLKSFKKNASNQIKDAVKDHFESLKDDPSAINDIKSEIDGAFSDLLGECENSKNKVDELEKDTENFIEESKEKVSKIGDNFPPITDSEVSEEECPKGTEGDPPQDALDKVKNGGSFRKDVNDFESNVKQIQENVNALLERLGAKSSELEREKGVLETKKSEYNSAQNDYDSKKTTVANAFSKRSKYTDAVASLNTLLNNRASLLNAMNTEVDKYNSDAQAATIIKIYRDPTLSSEYDSSKTQEDAENEVRSNLRSAHPELSTAFKAIDDYNNNEKAITTANEAVNNSSSLEAAYNNAVVERDAAKATRDAAKTARDQQQKKVDGISDEIDAIKKDINTQIEYLEILDEPEAGKLKEGDIKKDSILNSIFGNIDIVKTLGDLGTEMNKTMLPYNAGKEDDVEGKLKSGIIKKIKAVCDYCGDMFDTFTHLDKLRDNAYMVDYIMDKSTFLTSQTVRDHHFKWGEVEYIIFGKETQIGNIAASVASLTMMRFAINFINYFITGPGELVARAIYDLSRGAVQTAKDMYKLLFTDEGCALCPSFKHLKLTYSDHMRLMLFMKFSNQQEGLKTVINTNMKQTLGGGDINNLYTRMTAEVDVEVNLLILPIFFGNFTGANFRNGKYVIKDSATLGY